MFEEAALVRAKEGEGTKVGLVMRGDRGWFVHDDVLRPDETLGEVAFRVEERASDQTRILVVDVNAERRYEFSEGGPVQVLTRHVVMLCGIGRRTRAGCTFLPLAFRRETRRSGEPPSDVSTTEFSHRFCEDGTMLYEGSTDRLSRENEGLVAPMLGHTFLRFP
jgi:hypothetical protein